MKNNYFTFIADFSEVHMVIGHVELVHHSPQIQPMCTGLIHASSCGSFLPFLSQLVLPPGAAAAAPGAQELLSVITVCVADGIIPQFNIFFIWRVVISIVK